MNNEYDVPAGLDRLVELSHNSSEMLDKLKAEIDQSHRRQAEFDAAYRQASNELHEALDKIEKLNR